MGLDFNIKLEQSQKLIMTNELKQAIEILQYNAVELNDFLQDQMMENPLLEMDEKKSDQKESLEKIDWKEYLADNSRKKMEVKNNHEDDDYVDSREFIIQGPTLREHLTSQFNLIKTDERSKRIGLYIIENLDENGYLKVSLKEIGKGFTADETEVEGVLKKVQGLDPSGIAARDLAECLLIQAKEKKLGESANYIIENYLEDIAYNRLKNISNSLKISIEEVEGICDQIKELEPKPGRGFQGSEDTKYIIPDAKIEKINGEYIITINDISGPRLHINSYYENILKNTQDEEAKEYLSKKLDSALWLIKNIEQRRETMKKVIDAILRSQMDFFEKKENKLLPLTLREIAEEVGVHESTVSRTTKGKYLDTPKGVYELKYFFTTGIRGDFENISVNTIKGEIKNIVELENPKKPLSDEKIVKILSEKGIKISRRTVAKYREELNIASSSKRKRYT